MPSKRCLKADWKQQSITGGVCAAVAAAVRRRAEIGWAVFFFLSLLPSGGIAAEPPAGLFAAGTVGQAMTESGKTPEEVEYQVKAAFIYNFMKFTEWPAEKMGNGGTDESSVPPMQIGIVGENPFGKAFEPLMDKKIKDRPLKLVFVPGMAAYVKKYSDKQAAVEQYWREQGETIRGCHVLFYCHSEKNWLNDHLQQVLTLPVLTVGETEGFLNSKGMIVFVKEENKVRFEIHLTQAERQGLKISSQLLKLARRVIQEKASNAK
ncbi:MAG: YfiR family protein [Anaerohalosphaeraceae bacterium]